MPEGSQSGETSSLEVEIQRLERWLLESRRDSETQIVAKGAVLNPPFQLTSERTDGSVLITIDGSSGSVTFECNRIVISKFRPNSVGFFEMGSDGAAKNGRFLATLAPAFQRILKTFPPGSRFGTSELYAKIVTREGESQKHARRRWKELKYEYGFDVDTDDRTTYWRGPSEVPVREPFPRPQDNLLRKEYLAQLISESCSKSGSDKPICSFCGAELRFRDAPESDEEITVDADRGGEIMPGLIDHRRPIEQGGGDEISNLQLLCETCNNKKMTACRSCQWNYHCSDCMWAFPEAVRDRRVVIILDELQAARLRQKLGSNLEEGIRLLISRAADA